MGYNRESELRERLNEFLTKVVGKNEDYYSRLTIEDFESLKIALKDINNIITYRTTITFIKWLRDNLKLSAEEYKYAFDKVINTKPNDNGYDVQIDGSINIIAEIKCNKPINEGNVFGSNQKNGIESDIVSLLVGKSKVKDIDYRDYYKFMVVYDFGVKTRQAINHLIKNLKPELRGKIELFNNSDDLNKETVYIVLLRE